MIKPNNATKHQRVVQEICSFLLIFLFVYTASSKLLRLDEFRIRLSLFPRIGGQAGVIAWFLPVLELIISALLFFPATRRKGFFASLFLLLVFTVYLGTMVGTQRKLPCTCGGVLNQMTWRQHIVFNIFFMVVSLTGILYERFNRILSPKNIVYET
jgi:hypothetical protein